MAFSALVWLAIGLLIMGLEIVVPGFVLFWFGVGGLLTSLFVFTRILPAGSAELQWSFFFVSSLLFLFIWHRYMKKHFSRDIVDEVRDPTIQGLLGRVIKPIAPGMPGEVELYDNFHGLRRWQAESEDDLGEGDEVRVMEARGIKLLVTRNTAK